MIKIERNNLEEIIDEYLSRLQLTNRRANSNRLKEYFITNLPDIIKAKPEDFDNIHTIYGRLKVANPDDFEEFKNYMINQYKVMRSSHGHWLLERLNLRACPYCNRQYTFTIKEGRISPELDHFKPKASYPELALSFYNLIPSCSTCNHTKLIGDIDIHPYFKGFNDNCKFILKTKEGEQASLDWVLKNDVEIDFSNINSNIKVFHLKELYEEHSDYLKEIISKAQAYNASYYDGLIESYRGLGKQQSEIDRFIWGSYLDNSEHEKKAVIKIH